MSAKVMQLVNELAGQDRWEEAYSVLLRFSEQQGADPSIERELGRLCFNKGKLPEAERHFQSALAGQPDPDCHYQLGLTLLKQDRPAEAMAQFRSACELKEGFAAGHLHWGIALSAMGSWRGALGQYNQAVKLDPRLVAAYYQAGLACLELGQISQAGQFFRVACDLDPKLAEAFNGAGVACLAEGKAAEAVRHFAQAWQVNNQFVAAKRNLANALLEMGRVDEAFKHYQEAVNLGLGQKALNARERAVLYNDWAVSLFRQKRLDEAIEKLIHAVDMDRSLPEANMNLGLVKYALQEYDGAAESFEKVIEANPDLAEAWFMCGISYLFLGLYQEALDKLTQARARGLSVPDLNLWLGHAQMALGQDAVAERHFERASEENPQNYLVYDAWGLCLFRQGRNQEAAEKFKRMLSLKGDYALGFLHLAKTLEAMGLIAESMANYRLAVEADPACLGAEKEAVETLLKHAQYELAMSKAVKLSEIAPYDPDVQLFLARALTGQNRLGESMQVLTNLVAERPDNGPAHVLIGQIHLKQGQLAEADGEFRQASGAYEGDVALYYSWGKTLSLLGLHELAVDKFQKANEFDPYDGDTYEAWGAALKILGRFQEAAEVYKRASEYV